MAGRHRIASGWSSGLRRKATAHATSFLLVVGLGASLGLGAITQAAHIGGSTPTIGATSDGAVAAFRKADFSTTVNVPPVSATVTLGGTATDSVFNGFAQTTQTANNTTNTLFGMLTNGLCGLPLVGGLACNVTLLTFTVHSVYEKPGGGEYVRDTLVPFQVPTPVDITGDGLPDVLVTAGLTSLNQVTFHTQKLLLAPTSLPASVELVTKDPTNTASPSRIAFGYDQRSASIPTDFQASATLTGFSPLHLNVGVNQSGADAGLTLTASLFNQQNNGTRIVNVGARAGFAPAPAQMTYDILADKTHQHLTYNASAPTTLTADVDLVDGSGEQTVHGLIDKLPTQFDVDMVSPDTEHRTVVYGTNPAANIGHVAMQYQNITHASSGDVLNTEVVGDVQNLPAGLIFKQDGAGVVSMNTQGGPIGVAAGGVAHLQHVVSVPTSESGARVNLTNGAINTAAIRLLGLSSVTVNNPPNGPTYADLQSSAQPLHNVIVDNEPPNPLPAPQPPAGSPWVTTDYDVHVNDLLSHLTITVDPVHGRVTEDGHGQGIGLITVDAVSNVPFFSKATHLYAELHAIPAAFVLNYTVGSGTTAFTLTAPDGSPAAIGEVDLEADDGGHSASVPAGNAGFSYYDLATGFAMAGRIYGLSSFSFSSDTTSPDQPLSISVSDAPGHTFLADVQLHLPNADPTKPASDIKLAGAIDYLPATMTATITRPARLGISGAAHVKYNASTPISKVDLDVTENPGFVTMDPDPNNDKEKGQPSLVANHAHAIVRGVPAAFDFDLTTDLAGGTNATMSPAAQSIEFYLDNGVNTLPVPGTTKSGSLAADPLLSLASDQNSGLAFHKVFGTGSDAYLAVAGRVFGLSKVHFEPAGPDPSTQPMLMEVGTAGGRVFDAVAVMDQNIDASPTDLTAEAEIANLPANVRVQMNTKAGPNGDGTNLDYQGTDASGQPQTIDRLEALVQGPRFFGDSVNPNHKDKTVNGANYVYAKVLGLPAHVALTSTPQSETGCATQPPTYGSYTRDICVTKPSFSIDTFGSTIKRVEVEALDHWRPSVSFPTWSSYSSPTPAWQQAGSPDADGVVMHDFIDKNLNALEYTLALQLSGLTSTQVQGSPDIPAVAMSGSATRLETCGTTPNCPAPVKIITKDQTTLDVNVDKAYARPFNVDVESNGIVDVELPLSNPPQFSSSETNTTVLAGFVNKPQPKMHVNIYSDKVYDSPELIFDDPTTDTDSASTKLSFGANGCTGEVVSGPNCPNGTAIDRLHLEKWQTASPDGVIAPIPGKQMTLDIGSIPNNMHLCMGTPKSDDNSGSGDRSGCLAERPRPTDGPYTFTPTGSTTSQSWPAYPSDTPNTNDGWYNANHSVVLNVDDAGTSGTNPMTINAYVCVKTLAAHTANGTAVVTCDPTNAPHTTSDQTYLLDGPGAFLEVQDLQIHNVFLDLYGTGSVSGLSGHIGLDTRDQPFSATRVHYVDQTVTAKFGASGPTQSTAHLLVTADASFPQNFSAHYRYTAFHHQAPGPAGKYDSGSEWGFVPCVSDSSVNQPTLQAVADIESSATFGENIAPRFLCHVNDSGLPNPWYLSGVYQP